MQPHQEPVVQELADLTAKQEALRHLIKELAIGLCCGLVVTAIWCAFLYVMEEALWPSLVAYL